MSIRRVVIAVRGQALPVGYRALRIRYEAVRYWTEVAHHFRAGKWSKPSTRNACRARPESNLRHAAPAARSHRGRSTGPRHAWLSKPIPGDSDPRGTTPTNHGSPS